MAASASSGRMSDVHVGPGKIPTTPKSVNVNSINTLIVCHLFYLNT